MFEKNVFTHLQDFRNGALCTLDDLFCIWLWHERV